MTEILVIPCLCRKDDSFQFFCKIKEKIKSVVQSKEGCGNYWLRMIRTFSCKEGMVNWHPCSYIKQPVWRDKVFHAISIGDRRVVGQHKNLELWRQWSTQFCLRQWLVPMEHHSYIDQLDSKPKKTSSEHGMSIDVQTYFESIGVSQFNASDGFVSDTNCVTSGRVGNIGNDRTLKFHRLIVSYG